jgi:starch-binding outer membrane protein, SusD/RagB family
VAFFMSVSCDVVDIDPTHVLDDINAFRNMSDVENHLTGTYSGFRSVNYYQRAYGVLADMMADDIAENVESLGNYRDIVDWQYVANDANIANAWIVPYAIINDANLVLTNLERFSEEAPGQKARIRGQALAIRALAHFDLMRYFAQSYDRNSTALAIPIKLTSSITTPGRNTVVEVYDQIYADLAEARTLLSGTLDSPINTAASRSRIDATVVDAIHARVALYARDFPTAITSATNAINSGLDLASREDFPTIWTQDAVANEVIWSISFLPGQGFPGGDVFFAVNNRLSFIPSQGLLDLFDTDTDVRYTSFFADDLVMPTAPARAGQIVPVKYLGRGGAKDGNVNYKVFRMAEMYLIRAEAYANSNQDGSAMADLNTLRAARIEDYVDENLSGAVLKVAIAEERRKELFIEGHRWFDLRRAGESIVRGADCAAPATACELSETSHRWVWPIPQGELDANPGMTGQQNPNY